MNHFIKAKAVIKKLWLRFFMHNLRYSNNYKKIDAFYLMDDPWHMDTESENHRFRMMNKIIEEHLGKPDSILEIGCGEGHHSHYLAKVCKHLTGIDISTRAIAKLKKKYIPGDYFAADIFTDEVVAKSPYDLIIASEVLYYMKNLPGVIKQMQRLGRNIFITYFSGEIDNLDSLFINLPGVTMSEINYQGNRWRTVWWSTESTKQSSKVAAEIITTQKAKT